MTKTLYSGCRPRIASGSVTFGLLAALLANGCGPTESGPALEEDRFVALDSSGQAIELANNDGLHACVHDRQSGLTWSVEHDGEGLLARDNTFSWYSSDPAIHMNDPGLPDGGDCSLNRCDTEALVVAVNAHGLCGHHDWRLPTRDEAMRLADRRPGDTGTTLNPEFFPHAVASDYWTGSTFRRHYIGAWAIDIRYGLDRVDAKTAAKPVRLARGPDPDFTTEQNTEDTDER